MPGFFLCGIAAARQYDVEAILQKPRPPPGSRRKPGASRRYRLGAGARCGLRISFVAWMLTKGRYGIPILGQRHAAESRVTELPKAAVGRNVVTVVPLAEALRR